MRRLLRWVFGLADVPQPRLRTVVHRLDDVEEEIDEILTDTREFRNKLRGQLLTINRRINRLDGDDEDDELDEEEELSNMIEERRASRG